MITKEEMRALEDETEKKGTSKLELMENAGKEIAKVIEEKVDDLKNKRVLFVCYHGNNGGDGFVAARYLADKTEVDLLFLGDETKFKSEAKVNFDKIHNNELIQFISLEYVHFADYDVIVDALLGLSYGGELRYPLGATIDLINEQKSFKISVDVPTGLNPDTGEVVDRMINADLVITFHKIKKGLTKFKDKTVVVDIGITE